MRRPTASRPAVPAALPAALAAAPLRLVTSAQTRIHTGLQSRLDSADRESGMTTAEYAVGTVAACGFGGILYEVVTSPHVLELLKGVIGRAFKLSF